MALDPDILLFDEPSTALNPISSRLLDKLILELRHTLGTTIVVVTHELASIFIIGNNGVFLDAESRTQIATDDSKELRVHSKDPRIITFLTCGEQEGDQTQDHGYACQSGAYRRICNQQLCGHDSCDRSCPHGQTL